MDNSYLIPANSKKSMLYFGLFNQTDLVILSIGLVISFVALMIVPLSNTLASVLAILPGMVSVFLVFPIPNYHNVRTFLKSCFTFLTNNQSYVWKGWCVKNGDTEK